MILTEEQAKARVNSEGNLLNRFGKSAPVTPTEPDDKPKEKSEVTVIPFAKRAAGGPNHEHHPQATEIAARARLGESQTALAKEYGMTQQNVHRYEAGLHQTDEKAIEKRMDEIQDKALCKLMMSIGLLDEEKLTKLGAKDLSAVAANMAKVAGNVRPSVADGNAVHLHLYAPELRKESNYKTIEVSSL